MPVPAWIRTRALRLILAAALFGPGRQAAPGAVTAGPAAGHPAPGARHSLAAAAAITSTTFLPVIMLSPFGDLSVSRVELIQGITMSPAYRVHIANRPATLRVFVNNVSAITPVVTVRLTCYMAATPTDTLDTTFTAPLAPSEGTLGHTANFNLPAGCLAPGAAYVVQIDPNNALIETDETNNRYPAAGQQSFDYVTADPLTVVIVPVQYKGTLPPSHNNLAGLTYLTWMPIKVLPVANLTYELHPVPHNFTGDLTLSNGSGWNQLLNEITSLHAGADPLGTKIYYGLVDSVQADGCGGGCIAGMGWIGVPTSVGFAGFPPSNRNPASETFTHEMGHNFNRRHAPGCGASGVDTGFPSAYVNGQGRATIGWWGLDVAAATLKNPTGNYDYMSYCGPEWTSDYTYRQIADYRALPGVPYAAGGAGDALYVSGWMDAAGSLTLAPIYRQAAPPASGDRGEYRAEFYGASGKLLSTTRFDMWEAADGAEAARGFGFFAPPAEGLAALRIYRGDELLAARTAAGPPPDVSLTGVSTFAGGARVDWAASPGAVFRVRFSPDGGATWQVVALDRAEPQLTLPPSVLAKAPQPRLEIQASDGLRTATVSFDLPSPNSPNRGR